MAGLLLVLAPLASFAVTYQSAGDFVASAFDEAVSPQVVWLTQPHQDAAKNILGHPYPSLRLRYWQSGARTAWILEEIGKERPITIGVVVDDKAIADIRILTYREPRGDEVRHPFFLEQFSGLQLGDSMRLTGRIDGISGATLSVRAVTNISRYVLYLNEVVSAKAT